MKQIVFFIFSMFSSVTLLVAQTLPEWDPEYEAKRDRWDSWSFTDGEMTGIYIGICFVVVAAWMYFHRPNKQAFMWILAILGVVLLRPLINAVWSAFVIVLLSLGACYAVYAIVSKDADKNEHI